MFIRVNITSNALSELMERAMHAFQSPSAGFIGTGDVLYFKSRKDSMDKESIQSSTAPVPGYQMGK